MFLLAAMTMLVVGTQARFAQTWNVGVGADSANMTAALNDGTLTVRGFGDMRNFLLDDKPWYSVKDSITSLVIENGVTAIGEDAFSGCNGLTSVTIPNRVTNIGYMAFFGCTGLTLVTSLNPIPPTIQDYTFGSVDKATVVLYVPEAAIEAYSKAEYWNEFSRIENVTTSITETDRAIQPTAPETEASVIAPIAIISCEFTVGPNPINRQSGIVNFFWQGKRIESGTLFVYDATGNVVVKININDNDAFAGQSKRVVGVWDLTDSKGHPVAEGTYLVRGTVKTINGNGNRERVSLVLGVR